MGITTKTNLPKEALAATTSWGRIVDIHVVIFSWDWLLYKGFGKYLTIHLYMIFPLNQIALWKKKETLTFLILLNNF